MIPKELIIIQEKTHSLKINKDGVKVEGTAIAHETHYHFVKVGPTLKELIKNIEPLTLDQQLSKFVCICNKRSKNSKNHQTA